MPFFDIQCAHYTHLRGQEMIVQCCLQGRESAAHYLHHLKQIQQGTPFLSSNTSTRVLMAQEIQTGKKDRQMVAMVTMGV
eukprot:1161178-Pelagomonas_calceolata.AAC.4